jgi:hypothetical protein
MTPAGRAIINQAEYVAAVSQLTSKLEALSRTIAVRGRATAVTASPVELIVEAIQYRQNTAAAYGGRK